jgi:hypothetical protein
VNKFTENVGFVACDGETVMPMNLSAKAIRDGASRNSKDTYRTQGNIQLIFWSIKLKSPTCRILKTRNHACIIAARMALLATDAPATIRHGLLRNVWIFAMGLSDSTKLAMSPYSSIGSRATVYEPPVPALLLLGSLECKCVPSSISVSALRMV